jgi:putative oxidoreductase
MEILETIGKILFGMLFVGSGIGHFKNTSAMAGYARSKGLLFADLNVYLSGILLVVAPILYIFGIWETAMLISLAVFLTLTAFIFHPYWKEKDPMTKMNEQIAFNKEVSLIGAILIVLSLL